MKHEFDALIGKASDPCYEWPYIELAYTHSPEIPDINGKQVIADIYKAKGMQGIHTLLQNDIFDQFKDTIAYSTESEFSTYDVNFNGFVRNEVGKPIEKVFTWIKGELTSKGIDLSNYDYFHCNKYRESKAWPISYHRIACFAVTGGSEGHYVHVDVIDNNQHIENLLLAKTFLGHDHANLLASELSKLLA